LKAAAVKIRRAKVEDVPKIHALISLGTKRGKILRRPLKEILDSIHHFFVVEEDGEVVACCSFEIYNKKLAEVRSLVVEKNREGKGLATGLLDMCLREAKKKKIYEVLAITDRENLFKRQGFSEQLHGQKALFLRP
jgi:N-acetylglutamate synthase-like GNAT family acetyltransferase